MPQVSYRKQALTPCTAYFLDSKQNIVRCESNVTAPPSCKSCPATYSPVCAGGKTWPNRCAAECSGKKVTKAGKCQHCSGDSCKWASKGDICTLGSTKQCWAKKYLCGFPMGVMPIKDAVFGTCVPRLPPAAKPSGARRMLADEREERQQV